MRTGWNDRPLTRNTAFVLSLVGGRTEYWYPSPEMGTVGKAIGHLIDCIKTCSVLMTGDPEKYNEHAAVVYVNAAHIVSFQKAGGHR